jgi:hypothetical protein
MAMPPTKPAVETQNMALRAQKPMAVAWTVVERCVELVRLSTATKPESPIRMRTEFSGGLPVGEKRARRRVTRAAARARELP